MSGVAYPNDIMAPLVARSLELSEYASDPASVAHSQFRIARRNVARALGLANGWLLMPNEDTGFTRAEREHNVEFREDIAETFGCPAYFYAPRGGSARICAAVILSAYRPDDDGLLLEELPDLWAMGIRAFVVRRA